MGGYLQVRVQFLSHVDLPLPVLAKVHTLCHGTAKAHVHIYPMFRSFGSQSPCPPTLFQREVNQVLQGHDFEGFIVFNAASVSMTHHGVFVLGKGLAPACREPNLPYPKAQKFSSCVPTSD